jgi:hypothetical protein
VVIAVSQAVVVATPAPNSMVPELMVMVFEAKTAPTEATSATPLAISKARLFLFFPAAEVIFLLGQLLLGTKQHDYFTLFDLYSK